MLQHSEPKTNYISDMKPWETAVADLYIVTLTLVPLTVYEAGFLTSYTPVFFANGTLQYNSSSANYVAEMNCVKLPLLNCSFTKTCFVVLHRKSLCWLQ